MWFDHVDDEPKLIVPLVVSMLLLRRGLCHSCSFIDTRGAPLPFLIQFDLRSVFLPSKLLPSFRSPCLGSDDGLGNRRLSETT